MDITSERYFPWIYNPALMPFEPFISYEHWHRYRYAAAFVAGKAVLDIASGEGYGSAFLARHAASVVGVDLDPAAVSHAREHYPNPNLSFLSGSAGAIPVEGEHLFDVVVSFETIEHLDADTQAAFAVEIKRLLKPDGVLLISTPNRTLYSDPHPQKNPYHLREFATAEFATFLRDHFAHVRLLSQHLYPVSYIWNLDGRQPGLREYQMSLADGRFEPSDDDGKKTLYLIAVCTNDDGKASDLPAPDSLLLDLTEIGFRGVPNREHFHTTKLYVDTGAGFSEEVSCHQIVDFGRNTFAVTFTLGADVPVARLRWDPVERRLCRLRVHAVHLEDANGASHCLNLDQLTCNGATSPDGWLTFETLDPNVFFPVSEWVRRVTIEGECTITSADASLLELEELARTRASLLGERERELASVRAAAAARERELYARKHCHQTALYADLGLGFREECSVRQTIDFRTGEFAVTFTLRNFPAVTRLRWDPVEGRLCRLRLHSVRWEDEGGVTHRLDPTLLTANGAVGPEGVVVFATTDPMVFLPICGHARSVTIEGECTIASVEASLLELDRLARDGATELAYARRIIQACEERLQAREQQIQGLTASLRATENEVRVSRSQLKEGSDRLQAREREILAARDLLQEAREQFALAQYQWPHAATA